MESNLQFTSDDRALQEGFEWAKAQALAYVFTGDPVGDWYEAALPGREAFCMRDVSHQATGAHLLGLARHNRNMLRRFAENISAERDWCTYWEIDRQNLPCPVDFRDNGYFWYNFPANFDVIDCCLRQYFWSGDRSYLEDAAFRHFYAKSVNEYVRHWDKDGDGIMEHYPSYGSRGIATYNEEILDPLMGGDQIAAQYGAYLDYAKMMDLEERGRQSELFRAKAKDLQALYNQGWWNSEKGRYNSYIRQDRTFCTEIHGTTNFFALYFDLIGDPQRVSAVLDELIRVEPTRGVEERSYVPEILFRYGRSKAARSVMASLFDPHLDRREYPEVSYAMIGALGSAMMGINPDARERVVGTFPQLSTETGWAEMSNIPVFDTLLSIRHTGQSATCFTQQSGRPVFWRAAFPGSHSTLRVDGQEWPASHGTGPSGMTESFVYLRVCAGETHSIQVG